MNFLFLGDIVEILDSKRRPISKKDRKQGPYPYYGATGIVDYIDGYIFDEELVLVGEDGAKWKSMDNTAFTIKGKTWVNNHAHVLRPNNEIVLNQFLIYYLNFKDLSEYVKGITVPKLNQTNLKLIPIPVPPLQEQEKIVERIDKVFANIDKNQEKILNLKFLYFQMKDSFINKKLSNEKTQVLSSFSDIQYGYTPDKNSREKIQVPILRITDLQNNKVDWENVPNVNVSQETLDKFSLKKGDILFARTGGTLGKSYLFNEDKKAIFASYLIRVTNTKSDFNPKFLKYFFESTEYWKQVNHGTIGAAQPFFNGKKLGNLKIPYFNKDEQKLIIKKLDTLSDLIEKLNDLNMLKKNKYSNFQKSILQKEFSYE